MVPRSPEAVGAQRVTRLRGSVRLRLEALYDALDRTGGDRLAARYYGARLAEALARLEEAKGEEGPAALPGGEAGGDA